MYEFVVEEVDDDASHRAGRAPARRRPVRRERESDPVGVIYAALGIVLAAIAVAVVIHHPAPHRAPQAAAVGSGRSGGGATPTSVSSSGRPSKATPGSASTSGKPSIPSSSPASRPTGSPDCAAMQMTPVPPESGASQPAIPGLCEAVGPNWQVGCATGFQSSCGPALQGELACLRQAHHAIATADVQACAAEVERTLAGTAG